MKSKIICSFLIVLALISVVTADIAPISSISDSEVGKEVTVSGTIIAISNNIETDTIQTYEPGEAYKEIILVFTQNDKIRTYEVGEAAGILTLNDKTGKVLVSVELLLLKEPLLEGQKVVVTGLYAGKYAGEGLIYADRVYPYMERGYRDITVKELLDNPVLYFQSPVRIKGNVTQIDLTAGKTELKVDDTTATVDVLFRKELAGLTIDEGIAIEGEFQRNKIYAFTVKAEKPEPTPTATPTPTSTPTPAPTATPTPAVLTTPAPPEKEAGLPFYILVIIIAVVAVVGVFAAIKLREWLMFRRFK
ncbi:MAG: hypothetical protein WAV32_06310 [Halobacteriota archaeon]